ncbi:sialate O-acetylesterase [Poriferisphaera sp. WC338]|uniref:sialate O-acetylesterase n=1 Tax=Poriferisphaera sp. WC338 TaxID=3425129 RepID=UPI003D817E7E
MKSTIHQHYVALIMSLIFVLQTHAVDLNSVFTDHMVIQRDQPIEFFGAGTPYEEFDVHFNGKIVHVKTDVQGEWSATFPAMQASFTAHRLLITSQKREQEIEINDILIGDVWICAGQSNMGWGLFQTIPQPTQYQKSNQLRLLRSKTPRGTQKPSQDFVINPQFNQSWQHATRTYAQNFSAVSYYFGLKTTTELNIPIGLIESSLGGTGIQCWMPLGALQSHPDYDEIQKHYETEINWAKEHAKTPQILETYRQKRPSQLYNGMLHPLTRLKIKGMIWYQAENNAPDYKIYRTLFPAAIKGWRKVWGQGDFPFFFVQLPGFSGSNDWQKNRTKFWPYQRESQEHALKLSNTGMTVTIDLGHETNIHPKYKQPIGERLARHAIALEKQKTLTSGPVLIDVTKHGKSAILTFDHVGSGLQSRNIRIGKKLDDLELDTEAHIIPKEILAGFEVCGKDKKFYPALAAITTTNSIIVWSENVSLIHKVRYAFKAFPLCNLFNSEGLPAQPFRTDTFDFNATQ